MDRLEKHAMANRCNLFGGVDLYGMASTVGLSKCIKRRVQVALIILGCQSLSPSSLSCRPSGYKIAQQVQAGRHWRPRGVFFC